MTIATRGPARTFVFPLEGTKILKPGLLLAAIAAAFCAAPAFAALGPDARSCAAGRPSILVNVEGFKARSGNLRVQVYGDDQAAFLAKGGKLRRIDVPVTKAGAMAVCVAVPRPGTYAVAVRHDVNGDNKSHDWGDGGGFSNNPSLSFFHLKPSFREAAIRVGEGVKPVSVILLYRRGLSIGPERG
jgi:uncharacterized protein (DUF2141 family)